MRRFLLCACVAVVGVAPAAGQTPAPAPPTFRSDTTAVVVDVIVRDRKGQPVTDLSLEDFELREDGVVQRVRAMTLVQPDGLPARAAPRAETKGATVAAAGGDPAAPPGNTVVALVFDRLSPEARELAYRGAQSYLTQPYRPDDFIGVFFIDLSLHTLQTYTNDRGRLKVAIEAAAERATSVFGRESTRVRPGAMGDRDPATSPTAGAESPGPAPPAATPPDGAQAPQAAAERALDQMVTGMERSYELMAQEQSGHASTLALRAIVTSLGVLPGRKTVVYFTEGLALPESVIHRFDSLVELANQRNVAIYTVDAAGLRVQSGQAAAGRTLRAQAGALDDVVAAPDSATGEALGQGYDRAFTAIRSDPHASLDRLATLTGGFLVENTNDLTRGIDRIEMDRRFHYLLTYTPLNETLNGEYRRIAVKIRRPGVTVRARSGYTAVREPGTFPTLSYEAAPLAILARQPVPRDVPVEARAFRLPDAEHPGRVALVVRVPAGAVRYDVPEGGTSYRTDFSILARIKDASGEAVRKASQPYRLSGPAAAMHAAEGGDIVFFRTPDLPPGRYTVEYVVYDALADRAGGGVVPLDIAPSGDGLRVGDLVVVRTAEKAGDPETAAGNPLRVGDLLLYPNVGEPFVSGRDTSIPVYLLVSPSKQHPRVSARLAVGRSRQTLAETPLALGEPDPAGRISLVSRVQVGALPPGEYALVVTVTDGASTQIRSSRIEVVAPDAP
jgi:VWFA-related protein